MDATLRHKVVRKPKKRLFPHGVYRRATQKRTNDGQKLGARIGHAAQIMSSELGFRPKPEEEELNLKKQEFQSLESKLIELELFRTHTSLCSSLLITPFPSRKKLEPTRVLMGLSAKRSTRYQKN